MQRLYRGPDGRLESTAPKREHKQVFTRQESRQPFARPYLLDGRSDGRFSRSRGSCVWAADTHNG